MFLINKSHSIISKAITIVIVCLLIANEISFAIELKDPATNSALAPTSRFNPIVSITWDTANEKYIITENSIEKQKLIETSSFKDDVSFLYLNLLIGQFLQHLSDLSKEGVSERGLNNYLAKFKESINNHFADAVKRFDRFHFKDMHWENTALCLPYERKDDKRIQILRYYLPDGEKADFPDRISIPIGDGTHVILEDPLEEQNSPQYTLPKLIETASDLKQIIDSEQVKERYQEYKEKALYMLGNDAIVGRFLKDNGLTKEKVQAMLAGDSYVGLNRRTEEIVSGMVTKILERFLEKVADRQSHLNLSDRIVEKVKRVRQYLAEHKADNVASNVVMHILFDVIISQKDFGTMRYEMMQSVLDEAAQRMLRDGLIDMRFLSERQRRQMAASQLVARSGKRITVRGIHDEQTFSQMIGLLFPEIPSANYPPLVDLLLASNRELMICDIDMKRDNDWAMLFLMANRGQFKVQGIGSPSNKALEHRLHSRAVLQLFGDIHDVVQRRHASEEGPTVVNFFSASDITTPLLATDASRIFLYDAMPFEPREQEKECEKWKVPYLAFKAGEGFIQNEIFEVIGNAQIPILWELQALGATNIEIKKEREQVYKISFDWSYGEGKKVIRREIVYTQIRFQSKDELVAIIKEIKPDVLLKKADLMFGLPDETTLPPIVISFDDTVLKGFKTTHIGAKYSRDPSALTLFRSPYLDLTKAKVSIRPDQATTQRPGHWTTAKEAIEKKENKHLRGPDGFTISEYLVALDKETKFQHLPLRANSHRIARNTAQADLDNLVEKGILTKKFSGNKTLYFYVNKKFTPSKERNAIYTEPVIEDGRLVSGNFACAYPDNTPAKLLTDYNEFVVVNVKLKPKGRFAFAARQWWQIMRGYEDYDGITAYFNDGRLIVAYDKEGKRIYNGNANSIYINAVIKDGKSVGGQFVEAYPQRTPAELLTQYKEFIATDVSLDDKGGLHFAGKQWWAIKEGLENAEDIVLHFRNGTLVAVYDKDGRQIYAEPKEGNRNSVYINAKLKDGKKVGGEFIAAYPDRSPAELLTKYKEFVVTDIQFNQSGGFVFAGRIWWSAKSDYENANGITAHFKNGTLVEVYDNGGNSIYVAAKEGDRNSVYAGAKIINGKRSGGKFIGAYLIEAPTELLTKYKEFVVMNVQLNSSGGFQFAGVTQWHTLQGYENASDITAYFKDGTLVVAYNKDSEQIYAPAKEGDRNSIYIDADIRDGKRVGGSFVAAYSNGCPSQIFTNHREFIATNIELGPRGEFALGHKFFWHGMNAYKKATGITAYFKDGNLVAAYDKNGKQIDRGQNKKDRNHVYINATIESGKIVGGEFIGAYPRMAPKRLLAQYPDFVVTDIQLSPTGGFRFANVSWWQGRTTHKNATGVVAHFKNGKLLEAYDKDGVKIYTQEPEKERNFVYTNARIEDGKRVGGKLMGSYTYGTPVGFLAEHNDFVMTEAQLDGKGGFFFGGQKHWTANKDYKNVEGVTVKFKEGRCVAAYDKDGKQIYAEPAANQNSLYISAEIKDGKRIGGECIGAYPERAPTSILTQYEEFIITDIQMDKSGKFFFAGKFWFGKAAYRNAVGVIAHFKNGEVIAAYDKDGKQIFEKPSTTRNSVYVNAEIKNGKRMGGELIGVYPNGASSDLLKQYPDCIFTDIELNTMGGFYCAGVQHWCAMVSHKGAKGITAHFKGGELCAVYDNEGKQIYENLMAAGEVANARRNFDELVDFGDVDRLLHNLGVDGTYRILLKLRGFAPVSLRGLLVKYIDSLPVKEKEKIWKPNGKPYSFGQMRGLKFLRESPSTFEDILTDEIVRVTYRDLIHDHRFLQRLYTESENKANNDALRHAYLRAYQYYKDAEDKKIQWLNTSALTLKMYQILGIQFLMDKKKTILADEPGLGKTIQAIMAALNIRNGEGAKKVLIVAPKRSLYRIWKKEIEEHTTGRQTVAIVSKQTLKNPRKLAEAKKARFVIINYESLRGEKNKLREELLGMGFDFIIIDEAHRMRNESLQTQAIRQFDAEYKVVLTATPLVGRHIGKIFNLLNWLNPTKYNNKHAFIREFGGMSSGRIRRLSEEVRSFFLRRRKSDMTELPPKRYVNVYVTLNNEQREVYERIEQDFLGWLAQFSLDGRPSEAIFLTKFQKLRQAAIDAGLVEKDQHLASSKYEAMDKIIEEKIKAGEKVIIFTNYRNVVFALAKRYKKYGVQYVLGGMSARAADSEIEAFQTRDDRKIFISTYPSGSESIALTAGNNVIEVDKPVTYKDRYQSNDRPHRWGQNREVTIFRLTARDTIDEQIEDILRHGELIFKLAFEDEPGVVDMADELIEKMLKKLKYPESIIEQILSFKRSIQPKVEQREVAASEAVVKDGDIYVQFENGNFSAKLLTKDGRLLECRSIHEIIGKYNDLSKESKNLIRIFFRQQILNEAESGLPIKETAFWLLIQEVIPQLQHIDYDGKMERNIEITLAISALLCANESCTFEELAKNTEDRETLTDILYFMDRNNIFKLFSMMGILGNQYYFNGELLTYIRPINISFANGSIFYIDNEIVNAIAPNRRVEGAVFDPDKPFESTAKMFRALSKDEEIRLAIEAMKGNETAKAALIESNLSIVIKASRVSVSRARAKNNNEAIFKHLDIRELYSDLEMVGQKEMNERMPGYYQEYRNMSFEKYMWPLVSKAITREVYKHLKETVNEQSTLDEPLSDDSGSANRIDMISQSTITTQDTNEEERPDEEESLSDRTVACLKGHGFSQEQIDIFLEYANGTNINDLAKAGRVPKREINETIEEARAILQQMMKPSKGSPVTLLKYMHENKIFIDNAKGSRDMALQRGGNDSQRNIQRELKVLIAVGLVLGDSRSGYYLPEWLRNVNLENVIKENPELNYPEPNPEQVTAIFGRVRSVAETLLPMPVINNASLFNLNDERNVAIDFRDIIIEQAKAAKENGQKIIVALGTSWIPGYGKTTASPQYRDLNELIVSIRKFCDERDISFIDKDDDALLAEINTQKGQKGYENAKVVVLANADSLDKALAPLQDVENTFLLGVDKNNLTDDSYIRVMEMLKVTLNYAINPNIPPQSPNILIEKRGKFWIFVPKAEPMKWETLRAIYEVQKFA